MSTETMLKHRIVMLLLALVPWGLAAEPTMLSFRIIDSQTGEPVADARVIVNHGPTAKPSSAEMAQRNRQFQPQSLVISRGSAVNFPNYDATQHHVYSFSPAKIFELELFADQPKAPVVFDQVGVVEVGCNIHDRMRGFIIVTNSTLTARTNSSGLATVSLSADTAIDGELSLSLWHPRLENATKIVDFSVNHSLSDPVELQLDLTPERKKAGRLDGLQKRFQDL
ncbi:MAG: methylamine utilization protein [Pseudohongiellaceae bacterium]